MMQKLSGRLGPVRSVHRFWHPGLAASTISIGTLSVLVVRENMDSWRPIGLLLIGVLIGATLSLTDFGFSSAFRRAAVDSDYSTFRGHALMLTIGSILMVPVIHMGSFFGHSVEGVATPIGLSLISGGILFGIGMQLSGGCASGTLFLLGRGNLKFLLTLLTFVIGSTFGAAHYGFWHNLPSLGPVTVFDFGNWPFALLTEVILLACAFRWLPSKTHLSRKISGGAVGLAVLNGATLLVAGRPWSETFGFALWGSKIAAQLGFDPSTWEFWHGADVKGLSILQDTTSIMDFAIIAGAMLAASMGKRFELRIGWDWRAWLSAAVGGLMMGYGARLSDGCNIGAYFSAIVSGSLSGYVWAVAALIGSALGVRIRGRN